jgi:hypothetical protein
MSNRKILKLVAALPVATENEGRTRSRPAANFASPAHFVIDDPAALRDLDQSLAFHLPEPVGEGGAVKFGQALFRRLLTDLEVAIDRADLRDPQEFHALFWMAGSYLRSLNQVAEEQMVDRDTVRRWLKGEVTPPALRRRGVLASAMASLGREMEELPPPPFRQYDGKKGAFPARAKNYSALEVV